MAITLIVEDGTARTDANTYVSQADAVIYATNWGLANFVDAEDDEQITALYYAAVALNNLFGQRFISSLYQYSTQSLLWPRYYCYDNNGRYIAADQIPQCIKDAQVELAALHIAGTSIFPSESDDRSIKSESKTLGKLQKSVDYFNNEMDVERYPGFRKIELILAPVLQSDSPAVSMLSL